MPEETNTATATTTGSEGTTQQATTGTATQQTTTTAGASATTGAPEAYVWKGADGSDLYAPETVAQIEPIARELGMTQDQAVKFAGVLARFNEEDAKASAQALEDRKKAWADEVRKDAKLGGANFESTIRNVGALLDKMAVSDADKAFFKATGIGMHPAMVRLLHGVHNMTVEDSSRVQSRETPTLLSDAEVFYGKTK